MNDDWDNDLQRQAALAKTPYWKWDLVGDGGCIIHRQKVSWWRRMVTTLVLGSKWTRQK